MEPRSLKIDNRIICKSCRGENKVYRCKENHCSQCTDLKIIVAGDYVSCKHHYRSKLVLNTNCEYCDKPLYDNYSECRKQLKCKNCKTYNEKDSVRCYKCTNILVPVLGSIAKTTTSADGSYRNSAWDSDS